ncbi:MAG: glutamine-hydrolyzing GMP synthase [Nanoarchaeota archaeon]
MDTIAVLDFGGQYCHLISRRVREHGVYATVLPPDSDLSTIKDLKGIILSGGSASVQEPSSPTCKKDIFSLSVPVLGICYGHQLIAHLLGGKVIKGTTGEYGTCGLTIEQTGKIQAGLAPKEPVWMNHRDIVQELPPDYIITAKTAHSPIAAFECPEKNIFGVQYHPEVTHTKNGQVIIKNFLTICKAKNEWTMTSLAEDILAETHATIGKKKAIIGLSGGIDSSTAAILLSQTLGEQLVAVYVDTGLMRLGETELISKTFSEYPFKLHVIDAKDRFFHALAGISEPEQKRKAIGKTFIEVFDEIAKKEGAKILIQGTIYSDRIESGITKHSSNIKSHHNVGGLPSQMRLFVYEPLRNLYKDEVRALAKTIGLPDTLINRHVFPGPGNGVRVLGEVTPEKAAIVQKATAIIEEEIQRENIPVWMAFAVLLPVQTVGIQGDSRTYKYPIVIRIIESQDAMTANFARIPYDVLEKMSNRITNEIEEVNRVVYDISNKPPATMEWE